MGRRITKVCFLPILGLLGLCSCGSPSSDFEATTVVESEVTDGITTEEAELVYEKSMELQYAENFSVDYYAGGYTLLTTRMDGNRFLVVPEGKEVPKGLEKEIAVIQRPVKNLYLVDRKSVV